MNIGSVPDIPTPDPIDIKVGPIPTIDPITVAISPPEIPNIEPIDVNVSVPNIQPINVNVSMPEIPTPDPIDVKVRPIPTFDPITMDIDVPEMPNIEPIELIIGPVPEIDPIQIEIGEVPPVDVELNIPRDTISSIIKESIADSMQQMKYITGPTTSYTQVNQNVSNLQKERAEVKNQTKAESSANKHAELLEQQVVKLTEIVSAINDNTSVSDKILRNSRN